MIMLLSALKMGLWNDYVLICINMYNIKGIKKYDSFYVINNFKGSKKYDRLLLSAFIYITIKVVKNMTVFMAFFPSLKAQFTEMGLLSIFKSPLLGQIEPSFHL